MDGPSGNPTTSVSNNADPVLMLKIDPVSP